MSHFTSLVAAALEDTMSEPQHAYRFDRHHKHWPASTVEDRTLSALAATLRGHRDAAWLNGDWHRLLRGTVRESEVGLTEGHTT